MEHEAELDDLRQRVTQLEARETVDTAHFAEASHDHPQYVRADEVREIARNEVENAVQEEAPEQGAPPEEVFKVETPPEPEPEEVEQVRAPRSRRYGKAR